MAVIHFFPLFTPNTKKVFTVFQKNTALQPRDPDLCLTSAKLFNYIFIPIFGPFTQTHSKQYSKALLATDMAPNKYSEGISVKFDSWIL